MDLTVVPTDSWYIEPKAAWTLVVTAVAAASALLGYLNALARREHTQPRKDGEPRHYDKAA